MKLAEFDYHLPKQLIAKFPLKERDRSRLLVFDRKTQDLSHRNFFDCIDYMNKEDVLILNDTKVIMARAFGFVKKNKRKIEILLTRKIDNRVFQALIKPLRKLKSDDEVLLEGNGFSFKVIDFDKKVIQFNKDNILDNLNNIGHVPLPHYIDRQDTTGDRKDYQTVYAKNDGAIAAPTAGLHFTSELLKKIEQKGIRIAYLTLHVGYGTFAPVRAQDISRHIMHEEFFCIPKETVVLIRKAKSTRGKVFAVGTTTTRALEANSSFILDKKFKDSVNGWTNLFIYPPFKFKIVDSIITNYHLPKSTLYMLISAFAGIRKIKKLYKEAINNNYRFYSYGDATLIL